MKPSAPDLTVRRWDSGRWSDSPDAVVMEEPLQLSLNGAPLSVVMRTPGADVELALGLFHAEGIITSVDDVRGLLAVPAGTDQAAYERAGYVRAMRDANSAYRPW